MDITKLRSKIDDVIQATYDAGYYAGKAEMCGETGNVDGRDVYSKLNKTAIQRRIEALQSLLRFIETSTFK